MRTQWLWRGINFHTIVAHATSDTVHRSEFGFGDDERVGSGKLFRRGGHEFFHTVIPDSNRRQ